MLKRFTNRKPKKSASAPESNPGLPRSESTEALLPSGSGTPDRAPGASAAQSSPAKETGKGNRLKRMFSRKSMRGESLPAVPSQPVPAMPTRPARDSVLLISGPAVTASPRASISTLSAESVRSADSEEQRARSNKKLMQLTGMKSTEALATARKAAQSDARLTESEAIARKYQRDRADLEQRPSGKKVFENPGASKSMANLDSPTQRKPSSMSLRELSQPARRSTTDVSRRPPVPPVPRLPIGVANASKASLGASASSRPATAKPSHSTPSSMKKGKAKASDVPSQE